MLHFVKLVVVTGILAYLGLCFYLWAVQARYMYYPGAAPRLTPGYFNIPFEDISLTTRDGVTLHAWYVAPTPSVEWTVLHCHGNAGSIEDRLDAVKALHDRGLGVLFFDYRGFGSSSGKPTEEGTYADAAAAWRFLVEQRGLQVNRIAVMGESLGGAVAIDLARKVKPGALIVESTFASSPDMAAGMFPFLPARWLCRFQYNSFAKISSLSCPLLLAHGRDDEMIPYAQGRALYDAAPQPKQFVELTGGHNAGGLLMGDPRHRDTLIAFLKSIGSTPGP